MQVNDSVKVLKVGEYELMAGLVVAVDDAGDGVQAATVKLDLVDDLVTFGDAAKDLQFLGR